MPSLIFVYLAVRTVAAVALAVVALRRGRPWLGFFGQLTADGVVVLLVAAFGDDDVRRELGLWAIPTFAYLAVWEGSRAAYRWGQLDQVEAQAQASWAEIVTGPWRWMWNLLVIAPPVLAGLAVAFDVLVPGQLPFPNRPPPIRCVPATIGPRDTLTIRLEVPHGGELGIGTPANRFLVVRPFAAASVSPQWRFESQRELRLSVSGTTGQVGPGAVAEPVFVDSGTYFVRVSEVAEIAASLVCRVRYVSATAAAPLPPR